MLWLGAKPTILAKFYHYVKCGIIFLYLKRPFKPLIRLLALSMAMLFALMGLSAHRVKQGAGLLVRPVDEV